MHKLYIAALIARKSKGDWDVVELPRSLMLKQFKWSDAERKAIKYMRSGSCVFSANKNIVLVDGAKVEYI